MNLFLTLCIRAFLAYLILLFVTKLMGKRELAQISFRDFIVALTIGGLASVSAINTDKPFVNYLPAMFIIPFCQIFFSYMTLKSYKFKKLTNGVPLMLIYDGKLLENNLKKARITLTELISKLREKNIFNLSHIQYAIFEPHGQLSVMLKPNKRPLTAEDMNIAPKDTGLPILVIKEGEFLIEELKAYNVTKAFIMEQLKKQNITDISNIMLAQMDNSGIVYVDFYEQN